MSDLKITRLCADALRLHHSVCDNGAFIWVPEQIAWPFTRGYVFEPLHDDSQLMMLAKKFPFVFESAVTEWCNHLRRGEDVDLNHWFCEMVAETQAGKP